MTLSFELDSMTLNSAADPFRIGFMSGAPGTELLHEDAYLDIASATSGIYTVTWTNDFTDADARFLRVFIYAGRNSSCRIRRAKLEAGTRSTLHLDVVPMSSAEELPRIQRYVYNAFYKTNVNGVAGIGVATNSTTIDIRIPFPVAMYTPNYSLGYATYAIELFSPYYNHVKAPTAITQAYGSHTTTCCVLRITSSGLASGQLYWLRAKETSAGETGAWLNFTCIT
jgi:hypothetical protein